jgi:site-specific recombinase XerD
MKYEKQLERFREYLGMLNFSERTIGDYCKNTEKFLRFVEKHYQRITSFSKITKDVLFDYQTFITHYKTRKKKSLTNSSKIKMLYAVKKFFSYLLKNDLVLNNPCLYLTFPKVEKTLTRDIPTEQEVRAFLESLKTRTPQEMRNKAILELVYATGIRTSECCSVKTNDLDIKEQILTVVKGKGRKSRMVPLTQYACHYLELYLTKARKYFLKGKLTDPCYVFLTEKGNPFNANSLNMCVIRKIFSKVNINNKHITFYSFRHAVATHLLKHKVDIRYIAELLGHSSLNTTQRYTHVEISDLKRIHSLTHPREKTALPTT